MEMGDAPWKCFTTSFDGEVAETSAFWKHNEYQVWYHDPDVVLCNLLDNPDFDGQFDYQPYIEQDKNGKRHWNNMMSGNFAWHHSVSPESISMRIELKWINRMIYIKQIPPPKVPCTALWFTVLIRQQSLWPLVMLNIIHYTCHWAMFLTQFDVHITMLWCQLVFWPFWSVHHHLR